MVQMHMIDLYFITIIILFIKRTVTFVALILFNVLENIVLSVEINL